MNYLKVIDQRLLAVGLMIFLVFGCASNQGGTGAERGALERLDQQDVGVAPKHAPPSNAPAYVDKAQYRYHYYPSSEVYYNTWRRIYFYTEGNVWVSDALLPYRLRTRLGAYQSVEIYADTPYEYHRYVYKKDYRAPAEEVEKKAGSVTY